MPRHTSFTAIATAILLAGGLAGGSAAFAQAGPPAGRGPGNMPMMQSGQPGYGPGMMQGYGGGWGMMQGYGGGWGMMGYGPGYGGGYGMMGWGMMGWGMMQGHTAGSLAFLKTEIGITAAQEPQWQAFAAALGDMAGQMGGMHAAMTGGGNAGQAPQRQPLPEALAAQVSWMESHLAALKKLQAAAAPFYAVLSAAQKQKADSLLGCGACGSW